jgi:hypothetical protein
MTWRMSTAVFFAVSSDPSTFLFGDCTHAAPHTSAAVRCERQPAAPRSGCASHVQRERERRKRVSECAHRRRRLVTKSSSCAAVRELSPLSAMARAARRRAAAELLVPESPL